MREYKFRGKRIDNGDGYMGIILLKNEILKMALYGEIYRKYNRDTETISNILMLTSPQ